jgi:hypothetical protein
LASTEWIAAFGLGGRKRKTADEQHQNNDANIDAPQAPVVSETNESEASVNFIKK